MKKLLLSALATAALFAQNANNANTDINKKIAKLEKEIKQLKSLAYSNQSKINPFFSNDHIYWSADFRTALDFVEYKDTNDKIYTNNVLTNKFTLQGIAKPSDSLKFQFRITAYNMAGMNGNNDNASGYTNNWNPSETPNLRVESAFFNYFFGDGKYMFSAGRRPTVNSFPASLITNDTPMSNPISHTVNMEFDGVSFRISGDAWPEKLADNGFSLKFCAGRAFSNYANNLPMQNQAVSKDIANTNMAGFLLTPYNDGQYAVLFQNFYAWNVKGMVINGDTNGDGHVDAKDAVMDDLGDVYIADLMFKANGIGGDDASDFMLDTVAYVSFGYTHTIPDSGKRMLGSTDSKSGWSVMLGAQMDGFGDDDKWGFNLVHGSKYFRPFTYGEDTMAGSIAAVRGQAFDLYYNREIIPNLTANFRATYLKYNHAGSNWYFGDFGNPDNKPFIKHASDIRAYIRYKF